MGCTPDSARSRSTPVFAITAEKDPGWNVRADATGWIVSDVNASGPAARRIEPGDRLIALNGDGRAAVLGTANWADLRAGDMYRVDLERRGARVSYHLPMSTVGRRKMYPIFGLCGLAWFVVGAVLAFARPDDRQVLDGLQFAHNLGIVHRDLKPENVMIVETSGGGDALKIMDFGLAKVLDTGTGVTESVTMAGTAMGTLGYMAPEVLTGGLVDERADIFAIGVMVIETLTGVPPFGGQTQQEILLALLRGEYHLPGASAETRALEGVVQRCLAKDPRDRYASVRELAEELVPAVARWGGSERRPDSPSPGAKTVG